MPSQLSFLSPSPPPHLRAAWDAAVASLRSIALLTDFYVRPPPAADSLKSATFGTAFIRPPHLRLVAEEKDKRAHLSAALALAFPTPPTQTPPPRDLAAAIRQSLVLGPSVDEWRASQLAKLSAIALTLKPLDDWLRRLQPALSSQP